EGWKGPDGEQFTFEDCDRRDGFRIWCPGNFPDGWPDGEAHGDVYGSLNDSTIVWVEDGWPRFSCRHAHCGEGAEHGKKTWLDLQNYYDPERKLHSIVEELTDKDMLAASENMGWGLQMAKDEPAAGTEARPAAGQAPAPDAKESRRAGRLLAARTTPARKDRMRAALDDPRHKVQLPGDNRLLSNTAIDLGECLADKTIFVRNDEVVTLDGNRLRPITPQAFRTLVEKYVVCYRQRSSPKDGPYDVDVTMHDDESRGILASPQFAEKLRRIGRFNLCRLPVLRPDGHIELLPEGYDEASKTLTSSNVSYADDMPFQDAIATFNDLFSEFCFADAGRSKAVAVAALIGLYAAQLLPDGALRPCFIVTKNSEGAGASTIVACVGVPVLGYLSTGVKPSEEEEVRKFLTSAVREGRPLILFDNQRAKLSSASLEAFISGPVWNDRLLSLNQTFTGPNLATVFVTSNGCTVSPDMRRRSLFIELHLEEEHAEDRTFRRNLDYVTLLAMRPKILAACWSMVRNWHDAGQPAPGRSHSAFADWARVMGGIVEAAGFGCALETATAALIADEDGIAMQRLVGAMKPGQSYDFTGIVNLCRVNGCFENLVGEGTSEMKRECRSTLGKLLSRYDRRKVKDWYFAVEGQGHKRHYGIVKALIGPRADAEPENQHGDMVEHGSSPGPVQLPRMLAGREYHVRPCDHADPLDDEGPAADLDC
ncbi:MAG: hypothetical protein ABSG54_19080, partial [Terriglobia bacterium]